MRYVRALAWPLWGRIIRGEGGLWLVAVSLIAIRPLPWTAIVGLGLTAGLLLWNLYLFNDIHDADHDRDNPRKNHDVAAFYMEHRSRLWALWAGSSLLVLGLLAVAGIRAVAAGAATMIINAVYSIRIKAVPWLDIVIVGMWGTLYVLAFEPTPQLSLVAGIMTMVAHVYQVFVDRSSDLAQGLTTTAVHSPRASRILVHALAALLAACVWQAGGSRWALALAALVAAPVWLPDHQRAWNTSRLIFGLCWLTLLAGRIDR